MNLDIAIQIRAFFLQAKDANAWSLRLSEQVQALVKEIGGDLNVSVRSSFNAMPIREPRSWKSDG